MENNNKHLVDFGREFTSKIDIHTAIIDIVRMMADLTEALAAEIKRSDVLTAELKKAEANDADARCHVAELEVRCEALAAENAALKNAISCHAAGFTVCEACGEENISGNDDVCRALNETPATDAFLAEVRAQGVEMFALMYAEEAIKCNNITTGWRAKASRAASEYADLLRDNCNGGAL